MPIIAFAASKGGTGKSMLCQLVASELVTRGISVAVLDTDPQHTTHKWFLRSQAAGVVPKDLIIARIDTEQALKTALEDAASEMVFIDVQGALSPFLTIALVAADLTVVPSKATYSDTEEALVVFDYAKNFRRANLRLVLNEVKAVDVNTIAFKEAVAPLIENKIPMFQTMVSNRSVYAQFSKNAEALENLATDKTKTEQVSKARSNIIRLTAEILEHAGYGQ